VTSMGLIEKRIREGAEKVVASEAFRTWVATEDAFEKDDVVLFNNSYVFRDTIKGRKSEQYLGRVCDHRGRLDSGSFVVATPPGFNVDFKVFRARSKKLPPTRSIKASLDDQVARLGDLLFVLIGTVSEDTECTEPITHSLFDALRLAPSAKDELAIEGSTVLVNSLPNIETLWPALQKEAIKRGLIEDRLPQNLEGPLADAVERLHNEVYAVVRLPGSKDGSLERTILGKLAETLDHECREYEKALKECTGDPRHNTSAFNNVLRIAYNFSSDASRLIELLVRICDIKPVVLWCTLSEHFDLAEAFRHLPWAKSKKKPSLPVYGETIAGARNHAFHDLLPFDRAIEVDVGGLALKARRLRLFSPYTKRTQNALEYEDQEIVELLTQFTRAPEMAVAWGFWERNRAVMRATQRALAATAETLGMLWKSRSGRSR